MDVVVRTLTIPTVQSVSVVVVMDGVVLVTSTVIAPVVVNLNLVSVMVVMKFQSVPRINVVKVTENVKRVNAVVNMVGVVKVMPTVVPDVKVNMVFVTNPFHDF